MTVCVPYLMRPPQQLPSHLLFSGVRRPLPWSTHMRACLLKVSLPVRSPLIYNCITCSSFSFLTFSLTLSSQPLWFLWKENHPASLHVRVPHGSEDAGQYQFYSWGVTQTFSLGWLLPLYKLGCFPRFAKFSPWGPVQQPAVNPRRVGAVLG